MPCRANHRNGETGTRPGRAAAAVACAVLVSVLWAGCHSNGRIRGPGNAGGLVFAVSPPDAEVLLDGVLIGKASDFTGDRRHEAERGTHRLEFRKPGYETYVRDVYVSNVLLRIEATLLPGGGEPEGY